jgi:hypothetical protein
MGGGAVKTLLAFILGALLTGLATVSYDEHRVAPVPLVQADYPFCQTIRPPALLRTPNGRVDYRLGKPSNDRGET